MHTVAGQRSGNGDATAVERHSGGSCSEELLGNALGLPDDAAETELMTVAELLDNVP